MVRWVEQESIAKERPESVDAWTQRASCLGVAGCGTSVDPRLRFAFDDAPPELGKPGTGITGEPDDVPREQRVPVSREALERTPARPLFLELLLAQGGFRSQVGGSLLASLSSEARPIRNA